MPREVLVVRDFSGGLASELSDEGAFDNQCVIMDGFIPSLGAPLRLGGGLVQDTLYSTKLTRIASFEANYGFKILDSDRDLAGNLVSTKYYVFAGKNALGDEKVVQIFDSSGTAWTDPDTSNDYFTIATSDTTVFNPVFFVADGNLRISDANLSSTKSSTYWFGFIDRSHFDVLGFQNVYKNWYAFKNELDPPSSGAVGQGVMDYTTDADVSNDTNTMHVDTFYPSGFTSTRLGIERHIAFRTGTLEIGEVVQFIGSQQLDTETFPSSWATKLYEIYPPQGTGINLQLFRSASSSGTWDEKKYIFGATFVYDGQQESRIYKLDGFLPEESTPGIYDITAQAMVTGPFNPRITGINIYYAEEVFFTSVGEIEWYKFAEIDMAKGFVLDKKSGNYANWSGRAGTPVSGSSAPSTGYMRTNTFSVPKGLETYRYSSRMLYDGGDITARFKTAVVTKRSTYAGNVLIDGEVLSDTILKSPTNRLDVLTKESALDIVVGDGESIIKLEEFADRILQFKEKTMYILNVAQPVEFLEATYYYYGIAHPSHSIKTRYGIFWFNSNGVYHFDGETVRDVLLDRRDVRVRKISIDEWKSFYTVNSAIFYADDEDAIYIVDNTDIGTGASDFKRYSILLDAWSDMSNSFGTSLINNKMLNPDSGIDGIPLVFDGFQNILYRWESSSTAFSGVARYRTKSYSLGTPGTKKTIYSIYSRSRGSSLLSLRYLSNGSSDLNTPSNSVLSPNTTFTSIRSTPLSTATSRDIQSFALEVSGTFTGGKSPEVDSLEVIHRKKGLR